MSVITSSNRSRAEWDAYLERDRRPSLRSLMSENPRTSTETLIARSARRVPRVFAGVIATDECGAPITHPLVAAVTCENPYPRVPMTAHED